MNNPFWKKNEKHVNLSSHKEMICLRTAKTTLKLNASGEQIQKEKKQHFNNNDRIKTALSILVSQNPQHPPESPPAAIYLNANSNTEKYYSVFYCKEYIHQDQSLCTNNHCTYPQKNKKRSQKKRKNKEKNKKTNISKTICTFRVPIDYVIFVLYCWPRKSEARALSGSAKFAVLLHSHFFRPILLGSENTYQKNKTKQKNQVE